jgi:hypothetical protein
MVTDMNESYMETSKTGGPSDRIFSGLYFIEVKNFLDRVYKKLQFN